MLNWGWGGENIPGRKPKGCPTAGTPPGSVPTRALAGAWLWVSARLTPCPHLG